MTLPSGINNPQITNLVARVHPEARLAFDTYRLSLKAKGTRLSMLQVTERLCLALDQKHLRIVLVHALSEVQVSAVSGTSRHADVNFAARITVQAKLSFDTCLLTLRRTHPDLRHDYQLLQGLCLALELPYVREALHPWMTR